MVFKIRDNKTSKKPVFPFKDNVIYAIYYNPPFAYIRPADRLLLAVFSNFVEDWTIEYNGIEGKVRANLLYYGLPLMKKRIPSSLDPNLEDLEEASSLEDYYFVAMQWIIMRLENIQPNILMRLVDIMRDNRGMPIKVKELEGKRLQKYTGNIKGILYDLIDIIKESKSISMEDALPYGNKSALAKILEFLIPRSAEQARTLIYIILIGVIFVVVIMFLTTFSKVMGNVQHLTIFNQQNNATITLPMNTTNAINNTYHVVNPLK